MAAIKSNPYLFFKGNCQEAMDFYKTIFGGELTVIKFSDIPGQQADPETADWLIHANLVNGAVDLMASDSREASDIAAKVSISLTGEDEDQLRTIFEKLSQDIDPKHPLKTEFWGDIHGSLTDKFGIEWLVTITKPAAN